MDNELQLYTYFRSSASWRVRICLNLKKLKYKSNYVNLLKQEQKSEEYKKINPNQVVPTLKLPDGQILSQSIAILEYLEEKFKLEYQLLPDDAIKKAQIRSVVQLIASDIHPIQNLRVLKEVGEDKKAEWAKKWITDGFKTLEILLKETAGKYCFGDQISFADIVLVPQVYNAIRWKVDMSEFPIIVRVEKNLSLLDEFVNAHPDNQGDCPPS